jgi:stress-induced-phosphoprotein 1
MGASSESISAKERGSAAYAQGKFEEAAHQFSTAISFAQKDDENLHVYYSNRCASYLNLGNVDRALMDAEECTRLKPQWAKVCHLPSSRFALELAPGE